MKFNTETSSALVLTKKKENNGSNKQTASNAALVRYAR
jgi:hypothetical protein